ncbi:predicted protein [Naegleria gruberi]|uniref:Predicted protein n=1 Tax=Naegleria gruberi TaxID=5762 RepID=D2VRJ2_NAEGR|nr:uncharacterized protein NAEGRDRAFT_71604 [Naegleria gruberi]EFC40685.1 predicted protein [Naegleria gruberi]|eukprot:XP_002673429.1 predicted protein [Naegleria gruberi strain NEG-M]
MIPTNYYFNDSNENTQPQQQPISNTTTNNTYQSLPIITSNNSDNYTDDYSSMMMAIDSTAMNHLRNSITFAINSNMYYNSQEETQPQHNDMTTLSSSLTNLHQQQPLLPLVSPSVVGVGGGMESKQCFINNYYNSFGYDLIVNNNPSTDDPRRLILENLYPGLVGEVIGEGGYGIVYHIRSTFPNSLAVKMIEIKNEEHLLTEIQRECSRNLIHPHILKINPEMKYCFNYALVESEYMKDGSLTKYKGKLKPEMCWQVLHQIASALDYMHKSLFIHRDVKPENILIRSIDLENGIIDVVLSDFGLTRSLETLSSNPLGAGSLLYMAPEQFTFHREITPSSDVFSLGVTMINLIASTCLSDCKMGMGQQMACENTHPDSHFRRKITWTLNEKASPEMLDLIIGMTRRKSSQRISCAEIVSHCERALKSGVAYQSKTLNPISKLIGYSLKQSLNIYD